MADSTRSDRLHNLLVEDFGLQCTNLQNQYMRMHGRMQPITGINTALLPGLGALAVAAARRRWAATGCCSSRPPASSSRRSATWPAPPTTIWSGSTAQFRVDDGTRARRHSRRGAIDHGTLVAHRHEPGHGSPAHRRDRTAGRCSGLVEPAHVTEPDCAVGHPPADGALARVHRRGWSSSCCCCSSGPDRAVGTAATQVRRTPSPQ